jgi:hypothetical protein
MNFDDMCALDAAAHFGLESLPQLQLFNSNSLNVKIKFCQTYHPSSGSSEQEIGLAPHHFQNQHRRGAPRARRKAGRGDSLAAESPRQPGRRRGTGGDRGPRRARTGAGAPCATHRRGAPAPAADDGDRSGARSAH